MTALKVSVPASAEVLDLSTIKCKDFFETLGKEQRDFAAVWMHGYYRDEDDPPIIDFDKMKSDFGKLGAYCVTRPMRHGLAGHCGGPGRGRVGEPRGRGRALAVLRRGEAYGDALLRCPPAEDGDSREGLSPDRQCTSMM